MILPVDQTEVRGDMSKGNGDIPLSGVVEVDNKTAEPEVAQQTATDPYKTFSLGSPKSPKSLKERQQSRKAKYDRWKCSNCRKPFKSKAHPVPKKVILKLRETFDKYTRATWKKMERKLLTYSDDDNKNDSDATPAEMRSGLQEHFSELLFPGALFRGESVQVPWSSLGQWLEINKKRFVNWPTGVRFPDASYQMMGFWNLTEVNALYGVKIVNWSETESHLSMPSTPLVFNQMGQTVVNIAQVEELTYRMSSVDSSSDFFSDSDVEVKGRFAKDGGTERKRLAIRSSGIASYE